MKPNIRFLLLLLAWTALGRTVAWGQLCATPGRDGNPTSLSGVVNTYFPGSGTAASGGTSITVAAASGATGPAIAAGDLLLVIQMQGATINSDNTNAYGANNASGAGNLTTDFTAGTYEYVMASSALATGAAGTITTTTALVNSYSTVAATTTSTRRSFQVVRIPQYGNVTLGGKVNALAWNGSIGGVLVLDVAGTLTLAGQTLNAAGAGFRGGAGIKYAGYAAGTTGANTDYRTPSTPATSTVGANGTKGEGTAGTPRYTAIGTTTRVDNTTNTSAFASGVTNGYPNGDNGCGGPGNAGGGGTDGQSPTANGFNAGGAGGGNGGAGGLGGAPRNNQATPSNGASQALGGVAFAATSSRLVMGGGGGAGSSNDGNGDAGNTGLYSSGAPGGGIILVRTGSVSGTGTANASGAGGYLLQGANSSGAVTNDATGGGGAGGTVLVTARTTAGLAGLTVLATGGAGSSNRNSSDVPHGPGGGGSGGIILANGALAATTVTGGAAGTTTYNTGLLGVPISTASTTFGATAGANGTSTTNISTPISNSVAGADCVADLSAAITATSSVNTGQSVTVQATFSNAGSATAAATGTVTLPAGAKVTSAPGGTISVNSSTNVTTITYAISSIAAGGSSAFTSAYTATTAGTLPVSDAVTSTTLDLVASNNSATASTTVSTVGVVGAPAPCANPGKDGPVTLSANPNTYFPSAASQTLAVGNNSITVGPARGATTNIAAGDLLLVIQMQGADINSANTDSYGDGVTSGGASGNLTTNFTAGTYEYVVAASGTSTTIAAGGTIALVNGLKNGYVNAAATSSAGQRTFQVVRVPQYSTLTLGANITALAWNGSSGGIVVLDVLGQTDMAGFTINATGAGFRGGAGRRLTGSAAGATSDYVTTAGTAATSAQAYNITGANGTKGEGTAGTPRYVNSYNNTTSTGVLLDTRTSPNGLPAALNDGYPNGDNGRGAPGTAGGGGTDGKTATNEWNSGGGGGANGGAGGRGGNSYNNGLVVGGEPGAAFTVASSSRLVLGGGGGSGTNNDGTGNSAVDGFASSGTAGGGIVILRTGTVSGAGTITANGVNSLNGSTTTTCVQQDGGGGAGAGGSILVTATTASGLSTLTLNAQGGIGGNTKPYNAGNTITGHGPGGGGGGGVILTNGAVASATSTAGTNGLTYTGSGGSTSGAFGAAPGANGLSSTQISSSIANSVTGSNCSFDMATTITGPTSANAGQPMGTFTTTFSNAGTGTATNVGQTMTLPQGAGLTAAQQAAIVAAYPGTTFTTTDAGTTASTVVNFGTLPLLVSGASVSYAFAFTAPITAGTATTTTSTTTTSADNTPSNNIAPFNTTIGEVADVTVSLSGPTTLSAGQPTGSFMATFTNEGPGSATNVARLVTLPTGASLTVSQQATIAAAYPNAAFSTAGSGATTVTTIDFGTVPSLNSDALSAVTFAFTAPDAVSASLTMTGNTSTTDPEGNNLAPNKVTLALSTVTTADVVATISGATSVVNNTPTGTFTVSFSNNGPQLADGVTRTVQLPTGLTGVVVSGADAGSYDQSTGLVTYSPSPTSLNNGAALTSTITFPIPATGGQVAATASVSTTTSEGGLTTNDAATAVMPAAYDLLTTISGPGTAVAGSPATLYVTTTNNGPNTVPTALQTVSIPSSTPLTNVYITNGGTYSYNNTTKIGTVTFPDPANPASGVTVNNLPSGQTIANSISFICPAENFAPTATVMLNSGGMGTGEVATGNNTANLNNGVQGTPVVVNTNTTNLATANESTTIATTSTIVSAGTAVTYTVTATNHGPGTATNIIEQVQLLPNLTTSTLTVGGLTGTPSGTTITYSSGGNTVATYSTTTGIITYATVASQASGSTQGFGNIVVTVPASTGNTGQLLATANVRTGTNDPVPADNVSAVAVKVTSTADLATTLTGPTSTTAGQTASYTVAFTNNGTGAAGTVAETMQLPAGLSNVVVQDPSGNVIAGAYSSTTGLVTFPAVASDAVGATQVYNVAFTVPGQDYSVSTSIGSGTPDNTGTNNSAMLRTAVTAAADVAVTVSGPATATVGNAVTYAVTTFNNGPGLASSVVPTMQLPTGLADVTTVGGTYDASTGKVTFDTHDLAANESRVSLVTFTMPTSPANGFVTGAATVTTASNDFVARNNTAALTTSVAPATPDMADLVTSIVASATTVTAGSPVSYNIQFRNNTTTTSAINVVPTAYLPAGLAGVVVKDGGGVVLPNAYNSATGQITFPTIASQSASNAPEYNVSFTAPANAGSVLIAASAVSTDTSDPTPGNNSVGNTVAITPAYDVVTSLAGPAKALPGSTNSYSVMTTNNGPSTATANTTQKVTLPAGTTATNISGGGTQSGNIITFPDIANQPAGANGAVTNSFSLVMPASGSLVLSATVASANESNTTNDDFRFETLPTNQVPVAENVWNTLQSARGNTANLLATTGLPISPLYATDPDGDIASYTITSIPDAAQGMLYYNGAAVLAGRTVAASGLSFAPASTFVGNATFTYTALDKGNAVSNIALYTIPVAKDLAAVYTTYNSTKGGSNRYVTGDVLAQVVDANANTYNSAGLIYDATTGALQSGAANGLPTTGTNATLTSGTLPSGVSLDPATGRLYVSNASQLTNTSTQTYTVTITTVDNNGGVTTQPVTFTMGGSTPLPVTLVAFTAQAVQNRDALLSWSTASEINNDHFEVERSFDGTRFTSIGTVAGHGTTPTASAYTLTDATVAAKASGLVYYRLKQVDYNGAATYSPVRSVSFSPAARVSLGLYPNPAQASTQLDLSALPVANAYQVLLLDATGRTVRAWTLGGGTAQPLDVQNLATGAYLLRISGQQPDGSTLQQTLRLTKD